MADKDPRDLEHYWHLIEMNRYIEIQDDSSQVHHMPCPFCGAGEWMVYEKSRKKLSLSTGATCKVCKRGARAEFLNIAGTEYELIQICGPKQPDWLIPQMRVAINGNYLH
jgi:hypothetical protein